MSAKPIVPGVSDRVQVILVRGKKVIYDSSKNELKFSLDAEPLKYCLNCGAETVPIIYVCSKCNKRYITQIEAISGKRVIIAVDEASKF